MGSHLPFPGPREVQEMPRRRFFQPGHQVGLQRQQPFCACLCPPHSPPEGRAHQPSPTGQVPVPPWHRSCLGWTYTDKPVRRLVRTSLSFPERQDPTLNLLVIHCQSSRRFVSAAAQRLTTAPQPGCNIHIKSPSGGKLRDTWSCNHFQGSRLEGATKRPPLLPPAPWASLCTKLLYLQHLPPALAGPRQPPCPLPGWRPTCPGMEEKRPRQRGASAGATSGQGHPQGFTASFLRKPRGSPREAERRRFGGFPTAAGSTAARSKADDLLEATPSPGQILSFPCPQSIRKTEKGHFILGQVKCFITLCQKSMRQTQGEHKWVSCTRTRSSLPSLDSTQSIPSPSLAAAAEETIDRHLLRPSGPDAPTPHRSGCFVDAR